MCPGYQFLIVQLANHIVPSRTTCNATQCNATTHTQTWAIAVQHSTLSYHFSWSERQEMAFLPLPRVVSGKSVRLANRQQTKEERRQETDEANTQAARPARQRSCPPATNIALVLEAKTSPANATPLPTSFSWPFFLLRYGTRPKAWTFDQQKNNDVS